MPTFDNDADFQIIFIQFLREIIDEVSDEVLEKLKEIIDEEIYDKGNPHKYKRQLDNGGLRGSFFSTGASIKEQKIQSEIYHNPESMSIDPENYIHGSFDWKEGDDIRDILADIIINGSEGSPHVGDRFGEGFWRESRDFWGRFEEWMDSQGIDALIEEGLSRRGLEWIKS
jgi:hypothetical protein